MEPKPDVVKVTIYLRHNPVPLAVYLMGEEYSNFLYQLSPKEEELKTREANGMVRYDILRPDGSLGWLWIHMDDIQAFLA